MKKITKRTGRKEKPEGKKIRQKKVYISDDEETEILKQTKKDNLTDAVRLFIIGTTPLS